MRKYWQSVVPALTSKQWHGLMMLGIIITGFSAFFFPGAVFVYAIGSATGVLGVTLIANDLRGHGNNRVCWPVEAEHGTNSSYLQWGRERVPTSITPAERSPQLTQPQKRDSGSQDCGRARHFSVAGL